MKKNRIFKQNINKISSKFYLFVGLVFFLCGSASAQIWYINNTADLNAFADSVNGGVVPIGQVVKIDDNADMTEPFYRIIGNDTNYFRGTFDGNGHTITINLTTDSTNNREYVGLFSKVDGEVIHLSVTGSINVGSGNQYVGGICGKLLGGDITNCSNFADIFGDTSNYTPAFTGGICGEAYGGISNCINNGSICGGQYVGGIVGWIKPNNFNDCGNAG